MAKGTAALPAVLLAMILPACGGDSASDEPPTTAAASADAEPSRYARSAIGQAQLDSYVEAGEQLEVDWAILAAADIVERDGAGEVGQRAAAIAYSLLANGAPTDYETALVQRGGGDARYAREVLSLADRLKASPGASAEAERVGEGSFHVPVEGPVVAGFGRSYGIAHNGVDIEAPIGTPVEAAGDGTVISAGFTSAFGNYSCVRHEVDPPIEGFRKLTTCYGNQSEILAQPGTPYFAGGLDSAPADGSLEEG